jgi:hypothetical protein
MADATHTSDPFGDPKFYKWISNSTALALAVMLGFTASIRDLFDDHSLVFSWKTIFFFVVGWFAAKGFWTFIRKKVTEAAAKDAAENAR